MICKWCGETIKTGSRTCRRCKREIPALSDCGGFYDLVPMDREAAPRNPEPQSAVQPPVRPVLPERQKSSPTTNLICGAAIALVLILLMFTISLSGKLAESKEEINRLREQNRPTEGISATQPATPIINGLEQTDPEPTDEPDEIPITLKEGAGEIELNKAQNAQLNAGILQFSLCRDGEEDAALTFTLQRRTSAEEPEEIFLQITGSDGIEIQSIVWHNNEMVELPEDAEKDSIFDYIFASPDAITEFSKPIDELGEGKSICTLAGKDENGEDVIITILNIVIE